MTDITEAHERAIREATSGQFMGARTSAVSIYIQAMAEAGWVLAPVEASPTDLAALVRAGRAARDSLRTLLRELGHQKRATHSASFRAIDASVEAFAHIPDAEPSP